VWLQRRFRQALCVVLVIAGVLVFFYYRVIRRLPRMTLSVATTKTGGRTPKASQVRKITSCGWPARQGMRALRMNSIGYAPRVFCVMLVLPTGLEHHDHEIGQVLHAVAGELAATATNRRCARTGRTKNDTTFWRDGSRSGGCGRLMVDAPR